MNKLNKYERFTCDWLLSSYPADMSYAEICGYLINRNELQHSQNITVWKPFEDDSGVDLVVLMDAMTSATKRAFPGGEPIGANIQYQYTGEEAVYVAYASFGTHEDDEAKTDSFGVPDDDIFYYFTSESEIQEFVDDNYVFNVFRYDLVYPT